MDDPTVRQVRAGLRRLHGTAPSRRARPLSVPELRQILAALDRNTRYAARDAAIILLRYASALRSSELAALTLADLETKPGGLLLRIRRSKTDQDGAGQVVGVAHGDHPDTDPISAVHHWLRHRASTTDDTPTTQSPAVAATAYPARCSCGCAAARSPTIRSRHTRSPGS